MEEGDYKTWVTSHRDERFNSRRSRHSAEYYCYTCIIAVISILIIVLLGCTGAFYWYIFEYKDSSSSSVTYVEVPISIRIDMEFEDAYRDSTSPQYNNFTNAYINEVDRVFTNTSLEDTYRKTNVLSLSPGSVLVNSSSFFDNKSDNNASLPLKEKLENLRKNIRQIIEEDLSNGMLGNTLVMDPNSSLFVGIPIIIQELPDTILPDTTEEPTVYPTTTVFVTPKKITQVVTTMTTKKSTKAVQSTTAAIRTTSALPLTTKIRATTKPADLLRTGICGTKLPLHRILGGQESVLGSMPWMGSIRTSTGAHYCGASLLTDQWAVTAAHCVEMADHLYFGGLSLDTPSDYEEVVPISVIFAHPDYNIMTENSDIALIRLARPVKISAAIRPVCVAHLSDNMDEVNSYRDCKAVGWGTTNSMGGLSPVLTEVDLPLVARDACGELSDDSDNSSYTKICAGNVPNRDTCTGDNGGPLVCRGDNNLWYLVGVTTRSSQCKSADIDVYTRVSVLHQFILHTVTQTDACIGTPLEFFCLDGCVGGDDCQTQCNEDEVRCNVGNCIPNTKVCDGVADCLDSTDEGAAQNCITEGCGGQLTILPGSGPTTITSPGYPNTYKNFQRCQWIMTTSPGNRVKLEFTEFETEEGYDFLHIGDANLNYVLSLSGDTAPLDILSLDNVIAVTFEADYASEKKGFSLQATSISEDEIGTLTTCSKGLQIVPDPQEREIMCTGTSECFDNSDEVECVCGDLQRTVPINGFIQIQSSNYGNGGYPENSFPCRWVVTASSPERRLEVTFIDFKTESGYDFLSVASGMEDNANVVMYTGHNLPPRLVSPTSELVFTFTTDTSGSAEGFFLEVADIPADLADGSPKCSNNFETLENDNMCDGVFDCSDRSDEPESCKCGIETLYFVPDGLSTELTSANYPSNYLHSSNCLWLVSLVNTNQRLHLHFNHFSLESNVDFLRIMSLNFTGSDLPLDIVSHNGEFVIKFESDSSVSSTGFSVTMTGIDPLEAGTYNFCDNGLEILDALDVCNNIVDCSDGSDEKDCGSG